MGPQPPPPPPSEKCLSFRTLRDWRWLAEFSFPAHPPSSAGDQVCGQQGADTVHCLDLCSGYEAGLPAVDGFKYRYYLVREDGYHVCPFPTELKVDTTNRAVRRRGSRAAWRKLRRIKRCFVCSKNPDRARRGHVLSGKRLCLVKGACWTCSRVCCPGFYECVRVCAFVCASPPVPIRFLTARSKRRSGAKTAAGTLIPADAASRGPFSRENYWAATQSACTEDADFDRPLAASSPERCQP